MAEKEDEEWNGDSHQIYHSAWCQTRGIPTARHLGCSELGSNNIFVHHLTYAHRRVPTKAPKSQVANGELEDGRTDYQERENPDESAADHGGLMGGRLGLVIEYFYLAPWVCSSPLKRWSHCCRWIPDRSSELRLPEVANCCANHSCKTQVW